MAEENVKAPNLIERGKEEIEAMKSTHKHSHDKETHGTSDDIDEDTKIEEVKGPGFFQRLKEEVEAIVGAILPKKKDSETRK